MQKDEIHKASQVIFDAMFHDDERRPVQHNDDKHDPKQKALKFMALSKQSLDEKKFFKAQKYAQKSLQLHNCADVQNLVETIKTEQYIWKKEQENKVNENEKPKPIIRVKEKVPIDNYTETESSDELVHRLLEQSVMLQQQNAQLKHEKKILSEKLEALQAKESRRGCCYECHVVKEHNFKPQDAIKIRSGVESSQIQKNIKMNIHKDRLGEWEKHTKHVDTVFFNANKLQNINDLNDEKGNVEEAEALNVSEVYLSYTELMKLMQEQKQRTEDVMTHYMDLNSETTNLKSIIKIYNADAPSTKSKYDELCVHFSTTNQKREKLQDTVQQLVTETNAMIDEENNTNYERCVTWDKYCLLTMELKEYQNILQISKKLAKKYCQFETNVEEKSGQIERFFQQKWEQHERQWNQWQVNDIIVWFKYLMYAGKLRLSKGFDLKDVEQKMVEQEISGVSLNEMDKSDLKLSGFSIFGDRDQVYKRIRALVERYPIPVDKLIPKIDQDTAGKEGYQIAVPQEYLCPISGNIMMDPVVAYDNKTYEKASIVEYITEHGRAPDCPHACDEDEASILVRNKELNTKIAEFLLAHSEIKDI